MKTKKSLLPIIAFAAALPVAAYAQDGSVQSGAANRGLSYSQEEEAPPPEIKNPPKSWVDPDTGHRVFRLTDEPGSDSNYFNVNAFSPDGKEMMYVVNETGNIGVVDMTTLKTRIIVQAKNEEHRPHAIHVGFKTSTIFYTLPTEGADPSQPADRELSTLWAANMETGEIRKVIDLPRRMSIVSINADETLGAGGLIEGAGPQAGYGGRRAGPGGMSRRNLGEAMDKGQMMERRLAAHYPMTLFTIDLHSGKMTALLQHDTDWLNHFQFSPTDPTLLLFCHEGMWWKVDRIWSMHTDGTKPMLIHKRTMENEIAGHEWWGGDGKTLFYQLHYPRGMESSFIASYNEDTGERVWLRYSPDMTSIHDNSSPDGKLFCGDGGFRTPSIFLLRPVVDKDLGTLGTDLIKAGHLEAEKLVNMAKTEIHNAHNYRLEPNPMFSPDMKYVIFRSNFFGPDYAFAVEVAKATTP